VAENIATELPPLQAANLMLEGGIIAYDTNVRSGGEGARYLGIDISREYRVDQVTVNLRAVDVRTGQVLANVMTSKTIYSVGRSAGVFKFIEFKKLLRPRWLHHQRTGAAVRAVGDRGGGGALAGPGHRTAAVAGGGGCSSRAGYGG
jgi:Uncharacterized protein involved in formation of curli polymers